MKVEPCGVCGRNQTIVSNIKEVLEIVHVGSGIRFSRCRKHMAVGLTEAERVKAEKREVSS